MRALYPKHDEAAVAAIGFYEMLAVSLRVRLSILSVQIIYCVPLLTTSLYDGPVLISYDTHVNANRRFSDDESVPRLVCCCTCQLMFFMFIKNPIQWCCIVCIRYIYTIRLTLWNVWNIFGSLCRLDVRCRYASFTVPQYAVSTTFSSH